MTEKTPEQIALERIRAVVLSGENRLDLGLINLTSIPKEIGELKHLEKLIIEPGDLTELPVEIGLLTNLTYLSVSHNHLTRLPPEIGNLKNLQVLSLSSNKIRYLPSEIKYLTELRELNLYDNLLEELPPEIGNLTKLIKLNLLRNNITKLPEEVSILSNLKQLNLKNNHLQIPPEILERVNEPQKIINYYFEIKRYTSSDSWEDGTLPPVIEVSKRPRQGSVKSLNEIKLILVGQGSVGKTSLVEQTLYGTYNQNQPKTDGISINKWIYENVEEVVNIRINSWSRDTRSETLKLTYNKHFNINIWDFGGQEIMHATHQFFLTKRSLYLLVLDARLTQEENRVEYWLKIIQSFGGESPVLIVGNKIDQHPLDIDRTGLQKKYPNIVGILETSATTGIGIEELKAAITEQVNNLPHVRDLLPETWFTVKTKLEELGRQSNFITHDKYLELCAENEVTDETSQRTLIGFLHDLGVVLHFQDDPRLEALGILNPQWVTNGVYKILNSHTLFQNKGVLTTSMLDEILNLPEYPRGKRLFIVDMMRKFELCYDIESDKSFLVPDLLPKDRPELKFNGIPAFEYAYPVLPSSVITRFIVRMNQKIDDGFVWRTGVVLKIGENAALVKADIEDRKITIAIEGLEHTRRDALSAIRFQLDEIHGSIKGLDAQKRVPIPNAPNAESLEYETLLMLESEGQEEYLVRDGKRLVKVNVRQILSGIESETQRKEIASRVINIYGDVKDSNILAGDENEVNK